jgi:two-component system cell cycle sensor histidine kinase/response regulator CckA
MNPHKNRRVLVIDDNRAIHDDFRKILSPNAAARSALDVTETELFGSPTDPAGVQRAQFELDSAYQGQEGVEAVKKALEEGRPYAMAFVDVRMPPGIDGVETTQKIWEIDSEVQIVICTAYSDYSWETMFEKIGNDDRMVILKKPFDTVEALQLAHALIEKWWLSQQSKRKVEDLGKMVAERTLGLNQANEDLQTEIVEHKQVETELRGKTAFLEAQINSSIDGILVVDNQGRKVLQNQRMIDLWKIPQNIADENNDQNRLQWCLSMTKNPDQFAEKVAYLYSHSNEISQEEIELKDGTILDRYSSAVIGQDGVYYGRIWVFRDITERKKIEAQLLQSQKLETVGKLAGGVAHEFNSIMTTIIGQGELLLNRLRPENPLCKNVTEIRRAADRAATLTRQLLAYGRKQLLQPKTLNLNSLLANLENMLRHLMGGNVEVCLIPATDLKDVYADAGQIEQVIMNMSINSRDAMPHAGKLILETGNLILNKKNVGSYSGLKPGSYVVLTITDTGTGMSPEVKSRVFEPFFSTKGVGEGTGLGLATCYGIINQSGGYITVDSEPGNGTTFKCYLPQALENVQILPQHHAQADQSHATETILLVEDNQALREMASRLLSQLGYVVLTTANAMEALSLMEQQGKTPIDLLFADTAMSSTDGKKLSERIFSLYPNVKILFACGYTENAIAHQGAGNPSAALLQKPYTPSALINKVRKVLDEEKPDKHPYNEDDKKPGAVG